MQLEELTKEQLWQLPLSERISILLMSVLERDTEALPGARGVLGILSVLASGLGTKNREKLAADMVTAANSLIEDPPPSVTLDVRERVVH